MVPPTCPTPGHEPSTAPRVVPGTNAHLLGTPALDAYRGYTGQSRSRAPTHTWNTLPLVELDVGGQPHDRGEPADQVAAALARTPDVTFAAADDPWHLDAQLRTEIAAHKATLAPRPPDRSAALDAARAWHQATQADL